MKYLLLTLAPLFMLAACVETTSTQGDYVDARDLCRGASELQIAGGGGTAVDRETRQTELLTAFSDCMDKRGWSVSSPGSKPAPSAPIESIGVAPLQSPIMSESPNIKRAQECRYARQAINHSSNARAVAKACELECRNQKRLAPDMPEPAACAE